MDFMSGLSAASTAISIAKDLREIDRSVDEASYKLKLADLTAALADTKLALTEARQKMSELETALATATEGEVCPICKTGRLKVTSVEKHTFIGAEFHTSSCDNDSCEYENQREYNVNLCKYGNRDELK